MYWELDLLLLILSFKTAVPLRNRGKLIIHLNPDFGFILVIHDLLFWNLMRNNKFLSQKKKKLDYKATLVKLHQTIFLISNYETMSRFLHILAQDSCYQWILWLYHNKLSSDASHLFSNYWKSCSVQWYSHVTMFMIYM
jgi:hypothetical protein